MKLFSALFCGFLFAVGLALSGMTQPGKVVGFLDLLGEEWDPSLLFVLGGATGTHLIFSRWILKKNKPVFEDNFKVPTNKAISKRLVAGSAIFGLGWGLAGICPGPAITSLPNATSYVLYFTIAMFIGIIVANVFLRKKN